MIRIQKVTSNTQNLMFTCSVPLGKNYIKYGKGKGKAIPLQALTGPEGSRRLRLPDFKTIGT
jgi:hypothetical protein